MEGQVSLFPEEEKENKSLKKQRKKGRNADPSQTYDERKKRFLHYMEIKGMNEQWIETAEGEIRIIIDALADYHDIASRKIGDMEKGYSKDVWEDRMKKIKKVQAKLENSIGYSRYGQLEICMKQKARKDSDIGEDAIVLAMR